MRGTLTLLYPSPSGHRLSQVKTHSQPNMVKYFPQRLRGCYFSQQHHLLSPTFPVILQPNLRPRSIQRYGQTNFDVLIDSTLSRLTKPDKASPSQAHPTAWQYEGKKLGFAPPECPCQFPLPTFRSFDLWTYSNLCDFSH